MAGVCICCYGARVGDIFMGLAIISQEPRETANSSSGRNKMFRRGGTQVTEHARSTFLVVLHALHCHMFGTMKTHGAKTVPANSTTVFPF